MSNPARKVYGSAGVDAAWVALRNDMMNPDLPFPAPIADLFDVGRRNVERAYALAAAPERAALRPDWTMAEGMEPVPLDQTGYLPEAPERAALDSEGVNQIDPERLARAIATASGDKRVLERDRVSAAAIAAAYDAEGEGEHEHDWQPTDSQGYSVECITPGCGARETVAP